MIWSQVQRQRLAVEKDILRKYFSTFTWINPTDSNNTRIEGQVKTDVGNIYKLRVYVPSDYPNSRPDMVVISPYPLKGYRGQDMKEHGTSGSMHTLEPRDGYLKICHYRDWLPNITLYKVVLKGRVWLEALEAHKRTGQPIDTFLSHM
jgi:ubiquitin-protein ligase